MVQKHMISNLHSLLSDYGEIPSGDKKNVVYAKQVDDICRGDWGPFESAFFNNTYIRSAESCTLVVQWYTHFKEH